MQKQNFCPICGKTKGRFIKGICTQCYQKKHSLAEFPDKIEIEQCQDCGKTRLLGKYTQPNKEQLAGLAEKKTKTKEMQETTVHAKIKETEGKLYAEITAKGILDSVPLLYQKTVEIEPKQAQCDPCMKLKSSYHEAIIQIRSNDKKNQKRALATIRESIQSQHRKDGLSAITATTQKKNGFDLSIGSKKAAQNAVRQLQKEFKTETKVSSKLLGKDKKGNIKKRFTFLARI